MHILLWEEKNLLLVPQKGCRKMEMVIASPFPLSKPIMLDMLLRLEKKLIMCHIHLKQLQ
jgi:hypothetical protein